MTSWEDTVMKPDEIQNIKKIKYSLDMDEDELFLTALLGVAQAQAKISFPAGRKEGIREVLEELRHYNEDIKLIEMRATNRWQAKLKEWGIDEKAS